MHKNLPNFLQTYGANGRLRAVPRKKKMGLTNSSVSVSPRALAGWTREVFPFARTEAKTSLYEAKGTEMRSCL